MLKIKVSQTKLWDEGTERFIDVPEYELELEHSLVSVFKWEAKWKKPFLSKKEGEERTAEETADYIRCMSVADDVPPNIFSTLSEQNINDIGDYIKDPMTATWFGNQADKAHRNNEVITAEIIYYWMIAQQIPMECQHWHVNQLLTLIRVCNIKNKPKDKKKRRPNMQRRGALNRARREQHGEAT